MIGKMLGMGMEMGMGMSLVTLVWLSIVYRAPNCAPSLPSTLFT